MAGIEENPWDCSSSLAASSLEGLLVAVGLSMAYLLAAYLVHPEPDTSNLGLLGSVIDHPFRYSDDINRFLLFLFVVLWPGRFIATTCVDAVRAMQRG